MFCHFQETTLINRWLIIACGTTDVFKIQNAVVAGQVDAKRIVEFAVTFKAHSNVSGLWEHLNSENGGCQDKAGVNGYSPIAS